MTKQPIRWSAVAILALVLMAWPGMASADASAVYYIDAVAGNDTTGDGSETSPWASLSKLDTLTLQPGDCVRLKRGSIWRERLTLDDSGLPGEPIVVEAYGTGDDPIISAGRLIPAGSTWVGPDANGEYTFDLGTTLEFYTADAIAVRAEGAGESTYKLLARGVTGSLQPDTCEVRGSAGRRLLVVKPPVGTSAPDFQYEVAKRNYAVLVSGDHVEVHDIDALLGNDGHPIYDLPVATGPIGATGNHCRFQNCRVAFGRGFGLYLTGTDSVIDGCLAEFNSSSGIALQTTGSLRNTVSGSIARFNGNVEWRDLDRGGISIQGNDAVIVGNTVHDNGNVLDNVGPRMGGDGAIQLFDCSGCRIENNYVANSVRTAIDTSYTAGCFGNTITGNVVHNWNLLGGTGTLKTQAISILGYGDTATSGTSTVTHNTIYSDQVGVTLIGLQVGLPTNADTIKDTVVQNNIIALPDNLDPDSIGLRLQRGHRYYDTTVDHNLVWLPNNTASTYMWIDAGGVFTFSTAAALAANVAYCDGDPRCDTEPGYETNGLNADPRFVALLPGTATDFDLDADSPCIDAGADVGRTADFVGREVPAGAGVDLGAFEYTYAPLDALTILVEDAVDLLLGIDTACTRALSKKLDGNGGVLREVTRAVEAYEAGDTSAAQYVRSLERALRKLDSFAFGVEGKARRGKIVDPELTALRGFVLDAESIIQDLIDDA